MPRKRKYKKGGVDDSLQQNIEYVSDLESYRSGLKPDPTSGVDYSIPTKGTTSNKPTIAQIVIKYAIIFIIIALIITLIIHFAWEPFTNWISNVGKDKSDEQKQSPNDEEK